MPRVLLINTNTMQPPVSPVALDHIASTLEEEGVDVALLDLAFVAPPDVTAELERAIHRASPDLIGLSVRNTDDCSMATRAFLLPRIKKWIQHIKEIADVPVVAGGVGFSIFPEEAFNFLGPDYGIAGEGEIAFLQLTEAVVAGLDVERIDGLVWRRDDGEVMVNRPQHIDLTRRPLPVRRAVDNPRYLREGGMVGIETKRGCSAKCIYCADPVSKGHAMRLRPPKIVVQEIRDLLDQGVDVFHTCDSEFNLPAEHAVEVCQAIREAGLGDRIRWYAYCTPAGFDEAAARLFRQAGCRGINFGADSGSDWILQRLRRTHSRRDIESAVKATKAEGMSCMIDLLLGAPGEERRSLEETIEMAKSVGADRVGLSIGLRVYPRTDLARAIFHEKTLAPHERATDETQPDLLQPYFWIEPAVGESITSIVRELVDDDPRFLFMDPGKAGANYNYNDNRTLMRAIREGHRGAFWDILRRYAEGIEPE